MSLLIGALAGATAALILFRWTFDGLPDLLSAFGMRVGSAPGWKLFHGNRAPWTALAKLTFGVLAPAAIFGIGAGYIFPFIS